MDTKQLQQAIANYFATQPVLKAWLFGSYARGEQTSDSDIDILFIPDKSHAERNYTTLPLASLHKEIGKLSSIQYFALAATVCYLTLIILFLFGTILLINRKQWKALFIPFFIIVGGSFALVLAVHGETRFKYPYMPFIFMLAAYAINIIISYIYLSLKEKNVIV